MAFEHRASKRFWQCYNALPAAVRQSARRQFHLLRADPRHPSLHFKPVGRLWSARVDLNHRALARQTAGGFNWVWIGTHEEYERMLRGN